MRCECCGVLLTCPFCGNTTAFFGRRGTYVCENCGQTIHSHGVMCPCEHLNNPCPNANKCGCQP